MSCSDCKETAELLEEGRDFIKRAMSICRECDIYHIIKDRQNCGCCIKFKIDGGQLIKPKCPDGKW